MLRWPSAAHLKDTKFTLLVDSEATYAFIEEMLAAATAPYRSKRIHIGMDEAGDMGTGAYRERHGCVERTTLMARHLERVNEIVKKLGLVPMMWSDMHIVNMTRQPLLQGYYPMDVETVPEDILESAPEEIGLVFWDYCHEQEEVYDRQLSLHQQFAAETIFAGGIWTWTGPSADYQKTVDTTIPALAQCRKHGIKQVFATTWGDDGGDTNLADRAVWTAAFCRTGLYGTVRARRGGKTVQAERGGRGAGFSRSGAVQQHSRNEIHVPERQSLQDDPL